MDIQVAQETEWAAMKNSLPVPKDTESARVRKQGKVHSVSSAIV